MPEVVSGTWRLDDEDSTERRLKEFGWSPMDAELVPIAVRRRLDGAGPNPQYGTVVECKGSQRRIYAAVPVPISSGRVQVMFWTWVERREATWAKVMGASEETLVEIAQGITQDYLRRWTRHREYTSIISEVCDWMNLKEERCEFLAIQALSLLSKRGEVDLESIEGTSADAMAEYFARMRRKR